MHSDSDTVDIAKHGTMTPVAGHCDWCRPHSIIFRDVHYTQFAELIEESRFSFTVNFKQFYTMSCTINDVYSFKAYYSALRRRR